MSDLKKYAELTAKHTPYTEEEYHLFYDRSDFDPEQSYTQLGLYSREGVSFEEIKGMTTSKQYYERKLVFNETGVMPMKSDESDTLIGLPLAPSRSITRKELEEMSRKIPR